MKTEYLAISGIVVVAIVAMSVEPSTVKDIAMLVVGGLLGYLKGSQSV